MKSTLLGILVTFSIILSSTLTVSAITLNINGTADYFSACQNPEAAKSSICKEIGAQPPSDAKNINAHNPVITLLKAAMEVVSFIAGAAAVILIIVSSIRYITSAGDPAGVKSSRDTLLYALVGIVVTALAQAIIGFVLNKVT